MSSGVRARCQGCGVVTENQLAGHSLREWDAEMDRMGWIVERSAGMLSTTHYCPACIRPFAVMLATIAAASEG